MKMQHTFKICFLVSAMILTACGKSDSTPPGASAPTKPSTTTTTTPTKPNTSPSTASQTNDCGTSGTVDNRLADCGKGPQAVQGVWTLVSRNADEQIWLNTTSKNLFWLPPNGGKKNYADARDYCLSKNFGTVVLRIPSQEEWAEMKKLGIKSLVPAMTGSYWTSTVDDANGTVESHPFMENVPVSFQLYSIADGTTTSAEITKTTSAFACIGRADNLLNPITFHEPQTHRFKKDECGEETKDDEGQDVPPALNDYGSLVCGHLSLRFSFVTGITGCTCKRSLFGNKKCMLYLNSSATLKCIK